jgi:hypothetical protein
MTKTLTQIAAAAALVAGAAFAPTASADMYFGAKAGPMMIDIPGVDDPTNAAVVLGKEWGVVAGDIGVQVEASTTIDDGAVGPYDVSIDTLAAYGVFRTAGPVYFIGKAGVLREEIDAVQSASDTGLSFGAGVGFSLGVAQIEVEYTIIEEDVSFLSAGIRF